MKNRPPAKSFEDLLVWQKAHQFVLLVYKTTKVFPDYEVYSLTSQFRRAAISICANISESFQRQGKKEKARFLSFAQGSLDECKYYLILSNDLGYKIDEALTSLQEEVSKMLRAYKSAILNDTNSNK